MHIVLKLVNQTSSDLIFFCDVRVQIAAKVAAPLARTNEIVILSGDGSRVSGEVNRLLAELPVSINALTGVDLTKVGTHPEQQLGDAYHKQTRIFIHR